MANSVSDMTEDQFAALVALAGLDVPAGLWPGLLPSANQLRQAAWRLRSDRPVAVEPAHVFSATERGS